MQEKTYRNEKWKKIHAKKKKINKNNNNNKKGIITKKEHKITKTKL